MKQSNMSTDDGFKAVSKCFVFKSRLQEYAQKVGISSPVYETIKEGPSHEPSFRSTVIVDDVRYDSLLGFSNRKAAEQSAAEVAILELINSGAIEECISQPVHETGLCKNLLQEYAQKMNYAIPSYECRKEEKPSSVPLFSCTVQIGTIKYIGAAARTKKEAEIKAARTALLAIQSSGSGSMDSMYTVIPPEKKVTAVEETTAALKPKKGRFKKRLRKPRRASDLDKCDKGKKVDNLEVNIDDQATSELDQTDAVVLQVTDSELHLQAEILKLNGNEGNPSTVENDLAPIGNADSKDGDLTSSPDFQQSSIGCPDMDVSSIVCGDNLTALVGEVNKKISGVVQAASINSAMCQGEAPSGMDV